MKAELTLRQQLYLYYQRLLAAQFEASENIEHRVTKGTLREQFIQNVLLQEYPDLKLRTGILECDTWQSTQGDLLWIGSEGRDSAFHVFNLHECKLFMEIKSVAQTAEFEALDTVAAEMKERHCLSQQFKVGMFCYKTRAKKKTVAQKFGISYDTENKAFGSYERSLDLFINIDCLFSLDIDEEDSAPYMLIRDLSGKCSLDLSYPVINKLFSLFTK